MSASEPQLPPDLQHATEVASAVDGVSLSGPWSWDADIAEWVLRCQLVRAGAEAGPVSKATDWHVLVNRYPWGSIRFMPTFVDSIEDTFWHQAANDPIDGKPWRAGALCLTTPGSVLGRQAGPVEPMDADSRLAWHFRRAMGWLALANEGSLRCEEDPFELPPLPNLSSSAGTVAYLEDIDSYRLWRDTEERFGYVRLGVVPGLKTRLVLQWLDQAQTPMASQVAWGSFADSATATKAMGLWIRLDRLPVVRLAQLPRTWDELVRVGSDQGFDIQATVEQLARRIRDGRRHDLLFGFPVASTVDGPPVLLHWLGLRLPVLSHSTKQWRGFRKGSEQGYILRDRAKVLTSHMGLDWIDTGNWDRAQRATRGVLPSSVRQQRVALIGVGALGSLLAEDLVRTGVEDLVVFDHDSLTIGNLVRHTLTLAELGRSKALAVTERLNGLTPQGRAVAVAERVYGTDGRVPESLLGVSVVLDASGSDEVLCTLDRGHWPEPILFFSASVSWGARHLFLFVAHGHSFPAKAFDAMLEPWGEHLRGDDAGEAEIWEGVGCWHPVWPGRFDHLAGLASCAIGVIERAVNEPPRTPSLHVLERTADGGISVNSACWERVVA